MPTPEPGRRGVIEPDADEVEFEPALVEPRLAGRLTLGGTGGRLSNNLIISAPFEGSSLADSDFNMSRPDDVCEDDSAWVLLRNPAIEGGAPTSRSAPWESRVVRAPD
jgi:hypothetical protein